MDEIVLYCRGANPKMEKSGERKTMLILINTSHELHVMLTHVPSF